MFFLLKFLKKEKIWASLSLIFMIFGSIFTISQALLIANIATFTINLENIKPTYNTVISTNQSNKKPTTFEKTINTFKILTNEGNKAAAQYILSFKDIPFIILLAIICFILIGTTQLLLFFRDFCNQYIAYRIANRIRIYFVEFVMLLPSSTFKNKKSGDFISRGINDIKQIQDSLFPMLESAFYGPILTVIGITTLLYINAKFTLIVIVSISLLGLVVQLVSKQLKNVVKQVQEKLSDITHQLQEIIYTIDIIKIFNRENHERIQFIKRTHHILRLMKRETFLNYLNRPISEILISVGMIGIVFFSANMIWNNEMAITEMFSFFAVLIYVTPYLQRISNSFFIYQKIIVSTNRIEEITRCYPLEPRNFNTYTSDIDFYENRLSSVVHQKTNHQLSELTSEYSGKIELKNVGFSYQNNDTPDEQATLTLDNISFTVAPGEFIALVGESGGGKTTLLNLISSLILPTKGTILFDDIPHDQLTLRSIRQQIALVSQESILFPSSIEENILYGKLDASQKEFNEAVQLASVDNFVQKFPKKYQTQIGERGTKISGGQKQRLCIARALIKNPKILLLDEATSSLDSQSEQAIQIALKKISHKQTLFVIAHRLSTILEADKIIVVKQGGIEAIGTHEELIKKCKTYSNLYKLQFRS